jgi:hypothetical protein
MGVAVIRKENRGVVSLQRSIRCSGFPASLSIGALSALGEKNCRFLGLILRQHWYGKRGGLAPIGALNPPYACVEPFLNHRYIFVVKSGFVIFFSLGAFFQ